MVPVAGSTLLSMKLTVPCSACPLSAPGSCTCTAAALSPPSSGASWLSGTEKLTPTGSTWLMVTSGVPLGCTRLPGNTAMAPARPLRGERMVLWLKATSLAFTVASPARTSARCASTCERTVSAALCAMKFCARRSCARCHCRSRSASVARSRSSCARAFSSSARSPRSSNVNSRSPLRTNWPSLMATLRTVLDTCGRISTLLSETTVPVASIVTGTSRCCTVARVTV